MKLFTYVLLAIATPLTFSLRIPSESSEEANQVAARANLVNTDSSLADDALSKRHLEKRVVTGITRQCYGTNGKFKYILQGVLITTSIVGNTLNYVITTSLAGTTLNTVIFDFGHGTYERALGDQGSFEFAQVRESKLIGPGQETKKFEGLSWKGRSVP
ncbi:hypothetical protein DDE82_008449 [Stemphylium lycopersici]|uniref:Uncharacterized protein n=1 Tax=Stemphylium lycopersici TaxID=183478 RepID=A0A364MRN0_STELY|nr:hypothetical protein DDE82_008449 [Stemphylium lycopersici]RAQ99937.1 hypothetical protein DDE83_009165 [Stemphylium lycopersici]